MQDIFIRFGLSPKESTALLELIRLGSSPVSVWAKHAKVKRSSMYVLLERLKSQGLISTFMHHNILYVQAVPVKELPALLSDKQQSLELTRDLLIKQMPVLQALEKTHGLTPKVTFYEGIHKVESLYEHAMCEKSFKSYFHPERMKALMPEYFHKIPLALRANHGKAKELLIDCPEAREYRKLYSSRDHEIRILGNAISFSSDTIITPQKIYLVGYEKNDAVATEIWNEELAQTQAALFDIIWSSIEN